MIEEANVEFLMLVSQFSYEGEVSCSIKRDLHLKDDLSKGTCDYVQRVVVTV